jgi:hypothetical protein
MKIFDFISISVIVFTFVFICILIYALLVRKSALEKKVANAEFEPPKEKNPKGGTHVVNQMNIVLGHIEIYGSICKDEALTLYGIKNLKAVIHKMRSTMKIKVINIYHPGTQKFYGYGIIK